MAGGKIPDMLQRSGKLGFCWYFSLYQYSHMWNDGAEKSKINRQKWG